MASGEDTQENVSENGSGSENDGDASEIEDMFDQDDSATATPSEGEIEELENRLKERLALKNK